MKTQKLIGVTYKNKHTATHAHMCACFKKIQIH